MIAGVTLRVKILHIYIQGIEPMSVPPSEIENIREGTYLGEINHEFCLEHIKSPLKAGSPVFLYVQQHF